MANLSFLGATRSRILSLLHRAPRTVHELAVELDLTDNAVRNHLLGLERDRLVGPVGRRPGVRKPSVTYALAAAGDQLFAKPYALVLNAVLSRLEERRGAEELVRTLREIGDDLARASLDRVNRLSGRPRVEEVARLIGELGGAAEVEVRGERRFALQGQNCPLAAIVSAHPEACQLAQALVAGLLGPDATVRECCRRDPVACRFEVDLGAERSA